MSAENEARLHELDLGDKREIEVMMHTHCGGALNVMLGVRAGDDRASLNLSPSQARAAAAVLVVAAEQAEARAAKAQHDAGLYVRDRIAQVRGEVEA